MKLLIIFVFGLAITVPTTHGQGRILNENARLVQFPYRARIDLKDVSGYIFTCGGSLISRNYILTAAHCLENKVNADVYLGAIRRYAVEAYRHVSRSNFIVHDGYNSTTKENNIALIKIPTVELTENIQLVELPKLLEKKTFINENVTVTRWGRQGTPDFPTGLSIRLKVLSNENCNKFNPFFKKSNLCAKAENSHTCAGDGGGPVVIENTKKQVAIVSYSNERACEERRPSTFVRITSFWQWIMDNSDVKLSCSCQGARGHKNKKNKKKKL